MSTFPPPVPPRGRLFAFILSFVIRVAPNCKRAVASLAAKTAGAINFAFLRHRVPPRLVQSCLPPLTRRIGSSFANGTKVCGGKLVPQAISTRGGGGGYTYNTSALTSGERCFARHYVG